MPLTTRTQMELGGKNPLIVMEDADLDKAVDLAIKGGFSLTGQACTGTSRLLVMKQVKAAFTDKLVAKVKALKIGSGMTPGIEIGPLATAKQLETVLRYIEIGKREATPLRRRAPEGRGLRPWLLRVAGRCSPMSRRPCASRARKSSGRCSRSSKSTSYEDAIAKANDTEYGLSAAIATRNPRYMHDFAQDIQSRHGEDQPHHHRQPDQRAVRRAEAVEHVDVPRVRPHRAGVLHADQDRLSGLLSARQACPLALNTNSAREQ